MENELYRDLKHIEFMTDEEAREALISVQSMMAGEVDRSGALAGLLRDKEEESIERVDHNLAPSVTLIYKGLMPDGQTHVVIDFILRGYKLSCNMRICYGAGGQARYSGRLSGGTIGELAERAMKSVQMEMA